jgi:hypothetical protein
MRKVAVHRYWSSVVAASKCANSGSISPRLGSMTGIVRELDRSSKPCMLLPAARMCSSSSSAPSESELPSSQRVDAAELPSQQGQLGQSSQPPQPATENRGGRGRGRGPLGRSNAQPQMAPPTERAGQFSARPNGNTAPQQGDVPNLRIAGRRHPRGTLI